MKEDLIGDLFRRADVAAATPATAPGIARRARSVVRRRRTRRRTLSALIVIAAGAGLFGAYNARGPEQPESIPTTTADNAEQLGSPTRPLRADADYVETTVDRMLLVERVARLRRASEAVDHDRFGSETDNTAAALMNYADRLDRGIGLRDRAVESYRDVRLLFPESPWAEVAGQRLRELDAAATRKDT